MKTVAILLLALYAAGFGEAAMYIGKEVWSDAADVFDHPFVAKFTAGVLYMLGAALYVMAFMVALSK